MHLQFGEWGIAVPLGSIKDVFLAIDQSKNQMVFLGIEGGTFLQDLRNTLLQTMQEVEKKKNQGVST